MCRAERRRSVTTTIPLTNSFQIRRNICASRQVGLDFDRNLDEHFVRRRLIVDRPGNKLRRLVTKFLCGRDQVVGQGDCRGTHHDSARRAAGAITQSHPMVLAARKPDGIDFVENSKISSFCENPPPTARYRTYGLIIPHSATVGV